MDGNECQTINAMKNLFIALLLIAATGLVAYSVHERNQLSRVQAQLATAQDQLKATQQELADRDEADAKIAAAERKAKLLQDTLSQASEVSAKQSQQVSQLQQSLEAAKTNAGSGLAGLLKDPAMKDMIKAQQKAVLGPMLEKNYAALFKQLNLTPEQTAYVKDLLQKKMMAASETGMSMLDGSLTADERKAAAQQVKSEMDAYDAQIKQYLGDDSFQTFQSYEKSIPDRMSVSQFQDQLAGSSTPLSDAQQQQLIQAMYDARSSFKWTTDYSNQNNVNADYAAMFSEDHLNQYAQEKAQFDQQFLQQAQQILNPDQLSAFQTFMTNQSNMQIMGMKMAAKMFAPGGP